MQVFVSVICIILLVHHVLNDLLKVELQVDFLKPIVILLSQFFVVVRAGILLLDSFPLFYETAQ